MENPTINLLSEELQTKISEYNNLIWQDWGGREIYQKFKYARDNLLFRSIAWSFPQDFKLYIKAFEICRNFHPVSYWHSRHPDAKWPLEISIIEDICTYCNINSDDIVWLNHNIKHFQ